MSAKMSTVYSSDFFKIYLHSCSPLLPVQIQPEFNKHFCIDIPLKGYVGYHSASTSVELFSGMVMIEKPEIEYSVTHYKAEPDETVIIAFTHSFYRQIVNEFSSSVSFFQSGIPVVSIASFPGWELITAILSKGNFHLLAADKISMDNLVRQFLNEVLQELSHERHMLVHPKRAKERKSYIPMLEKCKSFISENFKNNITLQQMADCAGMTKFHFNRAFKLATGYTPYRYLLLQRLYYAELLLKNTKKPISEIAIASGFNSLENFSAVFATYHGKSPSLYKKEGKD